MKGNDFVAFLLRSPLHGIMSGSTLLITVRGRKSGREITLPVNYIRIGNELWVLSSRDRIWWRNLRGGAYVRLRLRGRDVAAHAEPVLDEETVSERLAEYIRRMSMAARGMGIHMTGGEPDRNDLLRVAKKRLMLRVELAPGGDATN
jgi:deazaflavin-dependent oxidoreductase (nitroreductase family)